MSARAESPELALVDLRLPGRSGLELVRDLKGLDATTNVVVLTGYGSIATALESVRAGATTYLDQAGRCRSRSSPRSMDRMAKRSAAAGVPSLARVEWEHIQRVLADCDGNLSQAARLLGLHRRSLQRKLSKYPVPENG